MRIAIIGAGAVGGYYGGCLAAAGHEVLLVARGDHLQALQRNGLEIVSDGGSLEAPAMSATCSTLGLPPVDVVFLTVKLYDLEGAIELCRPLLDDRTFVIPLQNGVESPSMLQTQLGSDRVVGGVTYIEAHLASPGVVRRTGTTNRIDLAEPEGPPSRRLSSLAEALRAADVEVNECDDMAAMLWRKFVLVVSSSATTAICRQPIGQIRSNPSSREMLIGCIDEAIAVGKALGVPLEPDLAEVILHRFDRVMGPDTKASQLTDLERGRPLELEWLSGAVHRLGRQVGVATPVHSTIYASLLPFAGGSLGEIGS